MKKVIPMMQQQHVGSEVAVVVIVVVVAAAVVRGLRNVNLDIRKNEIYSVIILIE
jgi:hypothetical protein